MKNKFSSPSVYFETEKGGIASDLPIGMGHVEGGFLFLLVRDERL